MYMWILALLLFAKSVECATNSNEKLQFVPSLPAGKPYSLTNEEDAWSLKGLSDIANGIALTLRSHPPYDIIGNILDKSFGKGGKSPSISEVIDYEVPLIVMASFALSAAIIIPIVGLIFCCCRCGGKCGGNIDDRKLKLHPTKERVAYSVGILLCAFFLILAGSFILASSVRMNDSIPKARTVWKDSFGDIQLYSDNTLEELYHIAVKEAIPTIEKLLNDVIAMAEDIVVPVLNQGAPLFESLLNSVLDCSQGITQSLVLLSEVESAVPSLVSVSSNIQRELQMAQKNLSDAIAQCKKDSGGGACDSLPEGNDLQTEANFTKVPNVTDTHKKVEDVSKTNLTDEVVKGNESVHNILHKVQNLTTNLTKDFQNFSEKIQNVDADVLKPLKNDVNKYLQNSLYPLRDNVDDKYLGPNGMLSKYDKYRHVAFIVLGTLTLLDALLLIVAVILGQIGSTTYDTPSSRSNCTDWGGRLMIGAAGLFFFSAFLINLLLGILFLLGSNIAIVCDDLPDYKLLQKTIDDPKIMGEYILSKALFKDGNIPLTTSGILSDCSKNDAPWDAFKMDNLYNLSDVLSYKDKIPGIDKVFAELNSTITDTNVLSGEAKTTVNDSLNAGVHEINYTQFEEQVNKPIVKVSLQEFVSNLTKAAKAMETVSQQASDLLSKTASRLQHLDTTEVKPAKQQAKSLGQLTSRLKEQGNVIVDSAQRVVEDGNKVAHFLENDALAIAARGVTKHWNTVFGDVDYFLAFAINQVRFDVGRCKPLSSIYHGLTNTVCHHYTAGLNASWVAFGLCALVLLISIILCVRASKHFRRTRRIGRDEDDPAPAGEIEMPWMDRAADKQNLIHT